MVKKGGKNAVSIADKRRWKIGSAIIIVSFAIVIGLLIWLSYTGSTKEIVAVADQFKPDPSWELKSEAIEPPRTFCGNIECPSVNRQWQTSNLINREELSSILKRSGWNFTIQGTCFMQNNRYHSDSIEVCSADGFVNNYVIKISVSGSNPSGSSYIGINIEEK